MSMLYSNGDGCCLLDARALSSVQCHVANYILVVVYMIEKSKKYHILLFCSKQDREATDRETTDRETTDRP